MTVDAYALAGIVAAATAFGAVAGMAGLAVVVLWAARRLAGRSGGSPDASTGARQP